MFYLVCIYTTIATQHHVSHLGGHDSNFNPETGYSDRKVRAYLQSLKLSAANQVTATFPSTSFPNNYELTVLSFEAMQSELQTVSLNN
jgi:hypothetical protein